MEPGVHRFFQTQGGLRRAPPAGPAPRRASSGPCRRRRWVFLLLALLPGLGLGATTAPSEYQVKAVYLFNFLQFVEWPASAHASSTSPIIIGIIGDDRFGGALDEVISGEKIGGRALEVRRFKNAEDVKVCHLAFFSGTEGDSMSHPLRSFQGSPVLTVGETPGFAARGGAINFVMAAEKKVRFEANREAAARQGLKISSKLLNLATVVDGKTEAR